MDGKEFGRDVLKGASLGLGMVPGVSAGTMAVVVNIYERLIFAIANIRREFKKSFFSLLPIVIGGLFSSVLCFLAVNFGFGYAPFAFICLFAGIVIGTMPLITKEIKGKKIDFLGVALLLFSFIVAASFGVLSALSAVKGWFSLEKEMLNHSWWMYLLIFLAGFIAALSCLIPGISGAMVLFVMGLYIPILEIYLGSQSIFHNHERVFSGLLLTFFLALGAVFGLIVTGKGVKRALEKHRYLTFLVVVGFVLGSLVSMFINNNLIIEIGKGSEARRGWIYETTPLWEWITGPCLLVGASVLFGLISKRQLTDNVEKRSD